jgi:hypothetical protein
LIIICVLLSLAASHGLLINQMDVKIAFINGELEELFYMTQPDGFVVKGQGVILCLYVNDILIFGTSLDMINEVKTFLCQSFDMKDMSEVIKGENGITLT